MADVHKRVSERMLELGIVSLTEQEQQRIGLPAHSAQVTLRTMDGDLLVDWSGGLRTLGGEMLAEHLQLYANVHSNIRLTSSGPWLELNINSASATMAPLRSIELIRRLPVSTVEAPRLRKPSGSRFRVKKRSEYDWTESVGMLKKSITRVVQTIQRSLWSPPELLALRDEGERLAALDYFEELLAIDMVNVNRMPHQEAAAHRALTVMNGRAVLADEVGLGKTVEAGLVMKELLVRGLAKRVLVLTPTTLREQWEEELKDKFGETFRIVMKKAEGFAGDLLIMSLAMAKRNVDELARLGWDLVIVDEAHKEIRGTATQETHKKLAEKARYVLFLTATPVQNDLFDIFHLVEAVRPKTFTGKAQFAAMFTSTEDRRTPQRAEELRSLLSNVVIRTTREQAGVDHVRRITVDHAVKLSGDETELYQMCLNTVRSTLQGPGDANRRRFLAHRLTASPYSLAITAMRMAAGTEDASAANDLREIARRADLITRSTRQLKALTQVQQWIKEHGRVLVFAQHTDTVMSLLRLFEEEGIKAHSFHGAMSPNARRNAINCFRSRDVEVLVSSDAGAEGQNLQFCNCVLNYDLPWNPMKIEQRIGRVHRLTQTRDVQVANLFAVSTVDEHVYRVLHDKLRMFELLFGQITYVLGELEDDRTFENRIYDAVVSSSDRTMRAQLAELGNQAADASERARSEIGSANSISAWLADDPFKHRKDLPQGGATELRPTTSGKERKRQHDVTGWVKRYLAAIGAEIIHEEADDGQIHLVSAGLGAVEAKRLGGNRLHIAFTQHGLTLHPQAELCTAGSALFDELVDDVRSLGSVSLEVVDQSEIPQGSPLRGAEGFVFQNRRLEPEVGLQAHVTAKVVRGERESVLVGMIGDPLQRTRSFSALLPGAELPAYFGSVDAVTKAVTAELLRAAQTEVQRIAKDENLARRQNLTERKRYWDKRLMLLSKEIAESSSWGNTRANLRLLDQQIEVARDAEIAALSRPSTVELRAEALTVQLVSSEQLVVKEQWVVPAGELWTVTYPWDGDELIAVTSDVDGEPIDLLVICADGHMVDSRQSNRCACCSAYRCELCDDGGRMLVCDVCGREACPQCRSESPSICGGCLRPTRAPDLDRMHVIGWRSVGGAELLIGQGWAEVRDAGGRYHMQVSSESADSPAHNRMRGAAAAFGLPVGTGFRLEVLLPAAGHHPDGLISATQMLHEWMVEPNGGDTVDDEILQLVPDHVTTSVENSSSIWDLTDRLRTVARPPNAPALVCREVEELATIGLDFHGLVLTRFRRSAAGAFEQCSITRSSWVGASDEGFVALVPGGVAHAKRINTGFMISVQGLGQPEVFAYCPAADGSRLASELAVVEAAHHYGVVTPTGIRPNASLIVPPPPTNEFAELIHRTSRPRFVIAQTVETSLVSPGSEETEAAEWADVPSDQSAVTLPTLIAGGLQGPTWRSRIIPTWEVVERWRGHGEAVLTFTVSDGDVAARRLDDTGELSQNFGVCRDGHLHNPYRSLACPACRLIACGACLSDGALLPCTICGEAACGRCRTAPSRYVRAATCAVCERISCGACNRELQVSQCRACGRAHCDRCSDNDVCSSCRGLIAVSADDLRIPSWLMVGTEVVGLCVDRTATVIAVVGVYRCELAIFLNDGSRRWWVEPDQFTPATLFAQRVAAMSGTTLDVTLHLRDATSAEFVPADALAVLQRRDRITATWMEGADTQLALVSSLDCSSDLWDLVDGQPHPLQERTKHPDPISLRKCVEHLATPKTVVSSGEVVVTVQRQSEVTWLSDNGVMSGSDMPTAVLDRWHEPPAEPGVVGTPMAVAAADGVSVSVERANTMVVFVIDSPEGQQLKTFEALDELPAHMVHERLRGEVAVVSSATAVAPTMAQPTEATLVSRQMSPALVAKDATGGTVRSLTRADLSMLGIRPIAPPMVVQIAGRPPRLPPELQAGLAPTVEYHLGWAVREQWKGHGEVAVRYTVGPGEPAAPRIGGPPLSDFGVCSGNHLHEIGASWECRACERWWCAEDGPDGVLDQCQQCEQVACGYCRSTYIDVANFECSVCSRRSCGWSNHRLAVTQCEVCQRPACCDCFATDGRCNTCAHLVPVAGDDSRIPVWVNARQLNVVAGHDRTATIIGLAGDVRRELLVLRRDGQVKWLALQEVATAYPTLAYQLAIEAGLSEVTIEEVARQDEIPQDVLITLQNSQCHSASWEVFDAEGSTRTVSEVPVPLVAPLRSSISLTLPMLPYSIDVASPKHTEAILRVLPAPTTNRSGRAVLTADLAVDLVAITRSGLLQLSASVTTTDPWTDRPAPGWVPSNVIARNDRCLVCAAGDWQAALVSSAGYEVLVVKMGTAEPKATLIRGSALDLCAAVIRSSLELPPGEPCCVELLPAEALRYPEIHGGLHLGRVVAMRSILCAAGPAAVDLAHIVEALQLVLPSLPISVDGAVVERLITILIPLRSRRPVWFQLVPSVTDLWEVNGQRLAVPYEVDANAGEAFVVDDLTGASIRTAYIDNELHVVAEAETCSYCNIRSCPQCVERSIPCGLCGQVVCSRCSGTKVPARLCTACSGLKRASLLGGGGLKALRSVVLTGHDAVHEVRVVRSAGRWQVEGVDQEFDAMMTDYLEGLM